LVLGRFLGYNDVFKRKVPDKACIEGYLYENIEFKTSQGLKLKGWFLISNANLTNRTLILLHGWHRNRERLINHAKLFVDNGFHVIIYDQRSHGESDTGLITFGKGEAIDLLSCVEYLKTKPNINIDKLGALGFSLGSGGLVYAAASSEKSIFKAIVLEGAYANSYDTGLFMLQNRFGKIVGYLIGVMFFTIGTKIMSLGKFYHSKPYKYIGDIKNTPIMIVRGENDYMVPKYSSERLINAITTTKYIWINEGGNHTDSFVIYPEEYKARVLEFLNKYL
jgi:hypothetical protein